MCGIAGLFHYPAGLDERRALVARMGAAIRHRGPDESGVYADEEVAMGTQRLSVIDVAGGHQPMATEDDAIHIVYNGEVFNYRELGAALAAGGEVFRTSSDTEVVLRQYRREGLAGVSALNGMFAFALWDRRTRELHLVRDRLGVKPLYYYWNGVTLAFASEIKALLQLPDVERAIDPRALSDYLTFRYVPAPGTMWRRIAKLPAAHRLTISVDAPWPRVQRWWDVPGGPTRTMSDHEAAEEFSDLFVDAVRRRMVADVPVGIMLSGGLDSSAVASVAVESHGRNLKTFSVAFADSPATDERAHAQCVADHLGTDHAVIEIDAQDFLAFLPELVYFTDEPLADLASVPLYYVSRLARETVTVALSGEGADEILAGYDFDRWWTGRRAMFSPGRDDVRTDPVPPHMTNYMTGEEKRALLREPIDAPDSVDTLRAHLARGGSRHPLDQMLYLYCQDWLVEDLLMKADRMSMASSLEVRTPFLDYRLVEWAARAPLSAKIGPDASGRLTTKRVLRDFAAARLPAQIIERPKRGFPVPVYDWLATTFKGYAHDLVGGRDARVLDWLRPGALRELLERGTGATAHPHDRHRLWHVLVLEHWLRVWLAGESPAAVRQQRSVRPS